MKRNKVIIVGGGVIGLCTAYYALRRGLDVTLLDRGAPDGDNCSAQNAGMIVPSHFIPLAAPGMVSKGLRWMFNPRSPFYVRPSLDPKLLRWGLIFLRHANAKHVDSSVELLRDLNLESRRLFAELADDDDFGLVKRGLLMLCRTEKGLHEEAEVAAAAGKIGVRADVLTSSEAAALDPDVTMEIAGAVHFPQDCHLDPQRFIRSMSSRVVALGGRVVHEVEIDEVVKSSDRVTAVKGSGRTFEGDQFVFCGGSWTPALLKSVGMSLPLQPGKGYSLTLKSPPRLPRLCSILCEAKVAVTPINGSLRVAGTMEVGSMNMRINANRVRGLVDSIAGYLPEFRPGVFDDIKPWVGLRPVSPDGIPYLGKLPHLPNLHVSTGHAMMGLSLGPVSGRLMADLLTGDAPFRDIHGLAVNRF